MERLNVKQLTDDIGQSWMFGMTRSINELCYFNAVIARNVAVNYQRRYGST